MPPEWSVRPEHVRPAAVRETVTKTDERDRPPWWTEADQAELDALTRALVDGIFDHRPRCISCKRADGLPCPHIVQAIEAVVEWRAHRELLSRARWMRRQRELLEFERDVLLSARLV